MGIFFFVCLFVFPGCRQGQFQVLQYNSSVKIVRLMVEVTNVPSPGRLAEDAHQATLNVTIPDALRYSAVRSPVCPLDGRRGTSSAEVFFFTTYMTCYSKITETALYKLHYIFSCTMYMNFVFRAMMSNAGLMVH